MKLRLFICLFILVFIIVASSNIVLKSYADTVYTTTKTQSFTTTLTSETTETIVTTLTSHTTIVKTKETIIETSKVLMASQTVIVPTTMLKPAEGLTIISCTTQGQVIECVTRIVPAHGTITVVTYIPAIVLIPTTITSQITSYNTITETETARREELSTRTRTEILTLSLENVYTLLYTSEEEPPPALTEEFNINTMVTNTFFWGVIAALLFLVAALVIRFQRSKPSAPRDINEVYCIDCGEPIPLHTEYCPKCGAAQN